MSSILTFLPTEADRVANSDYAMTLEEIAAIEGISRQGVQQVEKRALQKLRDTYPATLELMRDMANYLRNHRFHTTNGVIQ